jgi:hypothetical protein
MRNTILIASLVAALSAGSAYAADQPANSEACFKALDAIAQGAEAKDLDDAMIEKVGEMLTKLDSQCDAGQLAEAKATMDELEGVLK